MKGLIFVFLIFLLPLATHARVSEYWPYQKMLDKADLIVIARPHSTKDTPERAVLPDIAPDVHVVGIQTEFEVLAVFKGDQTVKTLLLHHYRLADPHDPTMDGPALCDFTHRSEDGFLLFLVREPDGRYAPVCGQTDPDLQAVRQVSGHSL